MKPALIAWLACLCAASGWADEPSPVATCSVGASVPLARCTCEKGSPFRVSPRIKGMTLKDARAHLKSYGVEVRHGKLSGAESMFVTGSNPYFGAEICSGTEVYLFLDRRPDPVGMTDLRTLSLADARTALRRIGVTEANVDLQACGRRARAVGPDCGRSFAVVEQWPAYGVRLGPNSRVRLWLKRIDRPPEDLGAEASASACAHDGPDRNALAWRERRLDTVQVPREVREAAARVDTLLRRPMPPDGERCEVTVLPVEVATPKSPLRNDAFPIVPTAVAVGAGAPLAFRFWRRRKGATQLVATTSEPPALPPPRVIVDIPRGNTA